MSYSGANPFFCEMRTNVDGDKCGKPSAWVYKTGLTPAQLVCDEHAAELKAAGRGMRKVPVVEFALMELMPAREGLLEELKQVRRWFENTQATNVKLETLIKERWRLWLWSMGVGALVVVVAIWGWLR